jgi:hypothetical protein
MRVEQSTLLLPKIILEQGDKSIRSWTLRGHREKA